jgi:hypothetical protein
MVVALAGLAVMRGSFDADWDAVQPAFTKKDFTVGDRLHAL